MQRFVQRDLGIYFGIACGCAATLGVARLLNPDPSGFGTHRQLGLPPCLFKSVTGLPCPSCGMTTCFAYAARLDWMNAFATQPFGLVLFLAVAAAIPACAWLACRKTPVEAVAMTLTRTRYLLAFVASYLGLWLWRLI